jgi:hypothetical protein
LNVLLIGVPSTSVREVELRRTLALLAAFIQDTDAQVEMRVEQGPDWIRGLGIALGDRDLLACCTEESLPPARPSWIDLLSSQLQRPVYVFEASGYSETPNAGVIARFAPWLGSLAIILGFLWLQLQVSQQGENIVDTALLVVSVPVEIALIWLCNSVFG